MNTVKGVQQFLPVSIVTHFHQITSRQCELFFIQINWVVLFVLLHMPPEGFSLLVQTGCHLLVHVSKKQFGIGLQAFLGPLESLHHRLAGLLPPAPLVILAPPATGRHVMPQPGDGMVLLVPVVHLIHRTVSWAVITGAVVANSEESIELFLLQLACHNFNIFKSEHIFYNSKQIQVVQILLIRYISFLFSYTVNIVDIVLYY